jgi:hypothetical protein
VDCGFIVSPVCYESGDDFGLFVAKNHLGVFGSTRCHSFWETLLLICFLI